MSKLMLGLKVYSLDFYWKYGLSYEQAAKELKAAGIDYIITMSQYIPMYNSAVQSEISPEGQQRMATYSDVAFRNALRAEGIAYYGASNMFFDPPMMEKHGNVPVDQHGNPAQCVDWYFGACPTCESYVQERIDCIENAMKELHMDGVFLGFTRFPGFWELWLPGTDEKQWQQFCFCPRCVQQFQQQSGIKLPIDPGMPVGQYILANHAQAWSEFKSGVIHQIIRRVRETVKRYNPDGKILLNTVPFNPENFGSNGRDIFAQDPALLADVVDIFEVMGYHQILGLPPEWIGRAGRYFKETTGRTVVCTVQAKPLYVEGMHKGKGRRETLDADEFKQAVQSVKNSGLDGVVIFTWSDFLDMKYCHKNLAFQEVLDEL